MPWRRLSRSAHVATLVIAAGVCFLGAYLLAEFAFSWFGHDCRCTNLSHVGVVCMDQCISILGVTVSESAGKLFLTLGLPVVGTAGAGWLIKRAEDAPTRVEN